MVDERDVFWNKRPTRTYVSPRFGQPADPDVPEWFDKGSSRKVSHVIDVGEGLMHAKEKDRIVIRSTPAARYEIVATVWETDRGLDVLTIQKFNQKSGPSDKWHFSFTGAEIDEVVSLFHRIAEIDFTSSNHFSLNDNTIDQEIAQRSKAHDFLNKNYETIARFIRDEQLQEDLVAIGYRRSQLEIFDKLLNDEEFFNTQASGGVGPERVWQNFFERNKWIFGYGLSFQFLGSLDGEKLEQITTGRDLTTAGKRVDALMKTQALISSLCFIEIKHHKTALLAPESYRSGAWAPSTELAGGVAQVQTTVQLAVENIGRGLRVTDAEGDPTGEFLFNVMPRSFLVIGSLRQFLSEHGTNDAKYRSFELYRKNTQQPEIITFDELYERARFITRQVD